MPMGDHLSSSRQHRRGRYRRPHLSSQQILEAYIGCLGVDLLDNAPIFRTAGSETGPKLGRRWLPQPYSGSKMDRDFPEIRTACSVRMSSDNWRICGAQARSK